jgi:3-oxoacyl-[acyl-carrier protein] reductase
MEISLKNKKALVGGSTSGIGKAIALELAKAGADVTIMARSEHKLKTTLNELDYSLGQKHSFLVADFSDFESYKILITEYFNHHSIDILVNNTQGPQAGDVLEKSFIDYQSAFDLLFQTVTFTSLAALPAMKEKGYGRIINVSSLTVKEPKSHLVLSNTMRMALVSWSKSLANEIAKYQITVNSILTGYFHTERLQDLIKSQSLKNGIDVKEYEKNLLDSVPMKRFGKPEEYGYLASFLASDLASYITGASIPIDGGLLKSI